MFIDNFEQQRNINIRFIPKRAVSLALHKTMSKEVDLLSKIETMFDHKMSSMATKEDLSKMATKEDLSNLSSQLKEVKRDMSQVKDRSYDYGRSQDVIQGRGLVPLADAFSGPTDLVGDNPRVR